MNRNDPFGDLLESFFAGSAEAPPRAPRDAVARKCLGSTVAALQAGDLRDTQTASMLDGASCVLSLAESDPSLVDASIAVPAGHVAALRSESDRVKRELAAAVHHHGWRLREIQFVALDPGTRPPTTPPKRGELVEELARAVADKKAYEVEQFCDLLNLPPHPKSDADPWQSKVVYTRGRLAALDMPGLVRVAGQVLDEMDSQPLQQLIDRYRPPGSTGSVKNLIFGSTRKPDLVLADALSNDVALMNPEAALIYDDGIPEEGLSWRILVRALLPNDAGTDEPTAARTLYTRLHECLASPPERYFFEAYATRYRRGFDQPALIPQVWVHYDPRSRWERDAPVVTTQRMDFLLLLAGGRRVVCELDGKTHYTDDEGAPSPSRYAQMVRDDRELRLRGYEVYRFGASEVFGQASTLELVNDFFDRLLDKQ